MTLVDSEPRRTPARTPRRSGVAAALAELRRGRPVVVLDDTDRENGGDLVFAAATATTELLSFVVRHTSGFVCVALHEDECLRLRLPPMPGDNRDAFGTAHRVTVDLIGTGTGISASARARTVAALGSPDTTPDDLTRPGHVVPLMARAGGVLTRRGHTEAAVDLTRLAGLRPAGGLSGIVSVVDPRRMAARAELHEFAVEHGLTTVSIDELVSFRRQTGDLADPGPPGGDGAAGIGPR